MFVVKGFASHIRFTSNIKNTVHPIGEISAYSLTYAKDRGIYGINDNEDIRLYTFNSSDDGNYQEVSESMKQHIFTIVTDVYKKTLEGDVNWTDQVEQYLIDKHQTIANSFKCGKIIKDGNYSIPGWVEWKKNGEDSYIRIWFSDESFRRSYDEYEIVVVTPIEVVDNFFKPRSEVEELLRTQNDPVSMAARQEIAKAGKPNTIFLSLMYDWHDRTNDKIRVPTRWDILVYGLQGNNIDAIKDAIIDHVLQNSVHDIEEWKKIFPDIFKRTEFTIVPRWDLYAIPERTTISGIYSPIVKHTDVIPVLRQYAHSKYGYTNGHIDSHAEVMSHQYRSLQMLVISHPENRGEKFSIKDVYPDYISENTLTQDFNRMNAPTREFSEKLTEMIIEAESFDEYSATPVGMTRLKREGKLYLVRSLNHINYLVAAKHNFTKDLIP